MIKKGSSEWQSAVDKAHHECQKWQFLVYVAKYGEEQAKNMITPARGHLDKFQSYNYFKLLENEELLENFRNTKDRFFTAKANLKSAMKKLLELKGRTL